MARIENCDALQFFFAQRITTLAAAARHDFVDAGGGAITIHAPENTSRTFRSVAVVIEARSANSATTNKGSITSWLIGIKLGAVAFNDVTVTDTMTQSTYDGRYHFVRDVTSYFNTNFGSGTSQTCQVGFQFAQSGTNAEVLINITCKLYIQYEADLENQDVRVITVPIPLDSPTGALTTTIAEIGTNQVPALDTYFSGLASITYRQITFEAFAAEGNNNVTDWTTEFQLDSESPVADGNHEGGGSTSVGYNCSWVRHWRRDDMATNAAHAFKARATQVSHVEKLTVFCVVTLTYSSSSSSIDFVSLKLPFQLPFGLGGTTSSGDLARATVKFPVAEASPTLKQSGVFVGIYSSGFDSIGTFSVKVGGQSARGYTTMNDAGNDTGNTGIGAVLQRIDSGGAQGAGITLAQGDNELTIDAYRGAANTMPGFISGYAVVNYTCTKTPGRARTCFHLIGATAADVAVRQISTAPAIAEPDYRLFSVGVECNVRTVTAIGRPVFSLQAQYDAAEAPAAGWWSKVHYGENSSNTSIYNLMMWFDVGEYFMRWPSDPRGGMNLETSRKWMLIAMSQSPAWTDAILWYSYSSKTYTVSGSCSGNTGSTPIGIHRASTGELVATTSRSGAGSFSATVYDNCNYYYAEGADAAGNTARSDDTLAA